MKRLLKILCCVSLIFIFQFSVFNPVQSQRIHGLVSSGATLSQIEGDELKGFRLLGYSGGVGALAALDRNERWSISLEALFSQRGSYNASNNPYSVALNLNYIDIPFMLHFRDPWGGILIGLGLNYGHLVQQPHGTFYYDTNYFIPDTTDFSFRLTDIAAVADIRFPVWRSLWFNIRWQYSIAAVKRDWLFTELKHNGSTTHSWRNDCYNNSLTFRLIWVF